MKNYTFLIKPASSACNLRCRYCFYEEESRNRIVPCYGRMSMDTVEALLRRVKEDAKEERGFCSFAFQGGEPTLMGVEFFEQFVAAAEKILPSTLKVNYALQTNGVLMSRAYADFFARHHFLIGVSYDGTKDLQNKYRVDAEGKGTFNKVTRALQLLKSAGVETNLLCVVTADMARNPEAVYRSLKKTGIRYFQMIACLDPVGKERGQEVYSLTPEAYGKFLMTLFDLWYADWQRGDYISIRTFEDYVHLLMGDPSSSCATCGKCGSYYVVEADGSVYPCDFFCMDEWKLGMIQEESLKQLSDCARSRDFFAYGSVKPKECIDCRWNRLCNGGCKNDWARQEGEDHNYFCSSFRMLFAYAENRFQVIARKEMEARARYGR